MDKSARKFIPPLLIKRSREGTGEMARQVRALAALQRTPVSHSQLQLQGIQSLWPLQAPAHTHM